MDWSKNISIHHRELGADSIESWAWCAPISKDGGLTEHSHFTEWETCPYCGSISPRGLVELVQKNAGVLQMEAADMKYGWPHKVYVSGVVLHPDRKFYVGNDLDGNPHTSDGYRANIKFYTKHLVDESPEAVAAVNEALGKYIGVSFDVKDGRLRWRQR